MMNFAKSLILSVALIFAVAASAEAQYITSPTTQRAPSAGLLTPSSRAADEAMAQERIEALELRLAQIEQMQQAQRVLQTRNQLTEAKQLRARIEQLEGQVQTLSVAPIGGTPRTASVAPIAAPQGSTTAAELQTRYNDMAESLRLLQSQTDRLILQIRTLQTTLERTGADNEFRFQALESGLRRANTGISSTSDKPEVIGFVKRSAPVTGVAGASAVAASLPNNQQAPLVGEGDLSVLDNFGQNTRLALADPKALYERALKDLQAGNYAGAELDFAQLLAAHPGHNLAGNAQYWLGETHYVRRQFKQAAQAFLSGYTTYAKSKKAPDSLLKLGMTLTAMGEKKTGCDAFAELGAKFPDAPPAVTKRADIERKRAGCGS